MFYESELRLLSDTLRKCRVRTALLTQDLLEKETATTIDELPSEGFETSSPLPASLADVKPRTLYKSTDEYSLCYVYLHLPETAEPTVLLVGPYLSASLSSQRLLELGETLKLSPKSQRYLEEYYTGLPVLAEGSPLLVMLNTFCEHIWGSPSFAIADVDKEHKVPASPINESAHSEGFADTLVSMRAMEKRYAFENEMIQAVTLGQLHKESLLTEAFSDQLFERRMADPLRNAKNYGVIMNTLLRKAAEEGGVHPVYLDRVSSRFALRIEQMPSLSENRALMCDMFRSYCRLVRKHALKTYSPLVQKTVILIESDLSANLTLHSLAQCQDVSCGYLSTIFKKETGQTVSGYIREKRVRHAAHLLATTHLQVQTVAVHCGIMDVQYFSKIFKKQTGKTPKEYREGARRAPKSEL